MIGRRTFDLARGWGGTHPVGVPVWIPTHNPPAGWEDAPFTFVTEGVEAAVKQASEHAGDGIVGVAGASIVRQCLNARTHHPEDAEPVDGVTFLDCDVAEAVRIGLDAADGKNLEIFSPSIGTQLLERGLIDEVDLHVLPRLLGDGTACTTSRMGPCASCRTWVGDDPNAATNLRFRTTYEN